MFNSLKVITITWALCLVQLIPVSNQEQSEENPLKQQEIIKNDVNLKYNQMKKAMSKYEFLNPGAKDLETFNGYSMNSNEPEWRSYQPRLRPSNLFLKGLNCCNSRKNLGPMLVERVVVIKPVPIPVLLSLLIKNEEDKQGKQLPSEPDAVLKPDLPLVEQETPITETSKGDPFIEPQKDQQIDDPKSEPNIFQEKVPLVSKVKYVNNESEATPEPTLKIEENEDNSEKGLNEINEKKHGNEGEKKKDIVNDSQNDDNSEDDQNGSESAEEGKDVKKDLENDNENNNEI